MNTFAQAVENTQEYSLTENGALTLTSSLDKNVDLFFQIGASRQRPEVALNLFNSAFAENPELATKILLWSRDARGGAGERAVPRHIIQSMLGIRAFHKFIPAIIEKLPELGRWDDLLIFEGTKFETEAFEKIASGLRDSNGLCAKWIPRQGKTAAKLRKFMGMSPKAWRKGLVALSNTVEQKMCANQWDEINYNHVPSIAAARNQKAFGRHDPIRYQAYATALTKGDPAAKINASVVYPYDVLRSLLAGNAEIAVAQWEAMPNYLGDNGFILPMCDVSGSMGTAVSGSLTALDVCVSLGLYLADKQKGPFKDMMLTFSENSKINVLRGDLQQKVSQIKTLDWGMNTNLQAGFNEILRVAKSKNIDQSQMPKYLLIISDMQFDSCCSSHTNFEEMELKFEHAGYELPMVIFWNLCGRGGNVPVNKFTKNVALVSGFSPAIMLSVLAAKSITPIDVMLTAVDKERYSV